MKWRAKRWPYAECRRIVRRFLVLPHKIGCEYRWLETTLLMQEFVEGKWMDMGWTQEPIGEQEWVQVSRREWRLFNLWEIICYEGISGNHMTCLPFGKWLKKYHKGRL
jgi:hypothetical protein